MGDPIEFTSNYSDVSTQHGFQFEYHCDRCGNGYRTTFKPFAMGAVNNVLDTASSLLGGIFGSASNVSNRVTEAQRERAREEALVEAIQQIRPSFVQCPRCSAWVCRKSCWNSKRGLCKNCSPDLAVEISAAQAAKGVEGAWENAAMDEEAEKQVTGSWKETKIASCPDCCAPLPNANAKFCPECGAKLNTVKHCTECGAKIQAGAKFCAECGTKAG
jgi:hypothetical protein